MCKKVRPLRKSTAWSRQADRRGNENITPFFSPLPFTPTHPHPSPPSLFLSQSVTPGPQTDNPQGHLWPPSLAPPFYFSSTVGEKKGKKKARRSFNPDHLEHSESQTSISSSHRNFLPHHFLIQWAQFLHSWGWKGEKCGTPIFTLSTLSPQPVIGTFELMLL